MTYLKPILSMCKMCTARNVMPSKLALSPSTYRQSSPTFYGSITFTIWKKTLVWLIKLRLLILKSKGEEPFHVKQLLSLNRQCKIGFMLQLFCQLKIVLHIFYCFGGSNRFYRISYNEKYLLKTTFQCLSR
jgi:hypothetical protein